MCLPSELFFSQLGIFLLLQGCRLNEQSTSEASLVHSPGSRKGPTKNKFNGEVSALKLLPGHSSDLKPSTSENSSCPLEGLLPKPALRWPLPEGVESRLSALYTR